MAWNPNVPTVTNRVQDDLDAIRENFQHLAPLAQAVDELQAVSGLAAYVQALLSSRIVEMGSNSNGTYVRWENGLQVCWYYKSDSLGNLISTHFTQGTGLTNWGDELYTAAFAHPAEFVGSASTVVSGGRVAAGSWCYIWGRKVDEVYLVRSGLSTSTFVDFSIISIGRWK